MAGILVGQGAPDCPAPTAAMLALSLNAFDQTDAGWRSLEAPGFEANVADAITRLLACFDRPYSEAYACDAKGEVQP